MDKNTILTQFKEKVCKEISLEEKGIGRYLVRNPFIFEDGDHLVILLIFDKENKSWKLTDEGHTFQHLSYFMDEKDFSKGSRDEIIQSSRKMFGVTEKNGELFLFVKNEEFGNSLYDFVQCLIKITDISFLERDRVKTLFFEDFKDQMAKIAKKKKLEVHFEYNIKNDTRDIYPIDCYLKTKKENFFVFAIHNDNKCKNAIISMLMFERWGMKFRGIGVFQDQTEISQKVLAQFSDVSDKQISSMDNIDRFEKYLESFK